MDTTLAKILWIFAPLSFLSVGGGQSIIAGIHRAAVGEQHWMNDQTFLNLFALSRMVPGPGSLIATLVGWQVDGWAGALVASAAIFLPSSLLVFALAKLWERQRGARWQRAVETGLAPVAAGMIFASSIILLLPAEGGKLAWLVAFATCTVLLCTRTSPFLLMALGAVVFLLFWHS